MTVGDILSILGLALIVFVLGTAFVVSKGKPVEPVGVQIDKVEYQNHSYVIWISKTIGGDSVGSMVHDPDCKCNKE